MAVKIWAHRGSHDESGPLENTLAAFELALREHADGVELDVHLSADGVPFVFHDDTLSRLSEVADTRRPDALPAEILAAVPLIRGGRIPRLAAVLDLLSGHTQINIELKEPSAVPAVCRLLASPLARRGVMLSSFDSGALLEARRLRPAIPRALCMGTDTFDLGVRLRESFPFWALRSVGATGWHPPRVLVHRPLVWALSKVGIATRVWTVNTEREAHVLRRIGVAGIFTDRPLAARSWLGR